MIQKSLPINGSDNNSKHSNKSVYVYNLERVWDSVWLLIDHLNMCRMLSLSPTFSSTWLIVKRW